MSNSRIVLIATGLILAIIIVPMAIMFISGGIKLGTAEFRGNVSTVEQTKANAAFRIVNYNKFFNLCAEVKTWKDSLEIAQSSSERDAKEIDFMKRKIADAVNQYNVDVAKEYTIGQMRDSQLPPELFKTGETSCI